MAGRIAEVAALLKIRGIAKGVRNDMARYDVDMSIDTVQEGHTQPDTQANCCELNAFADRRIKLRKAFEPRPITQRAESAASSAGVT